MQIYLNILVQLTIACFFPFIKLEHIEHCFLNTQLFSPRFHKRLWQFFIHLNKYIQIYFLFYCKYNFLYLALNFNWFSWITSSRKPLFRFNRVYSCCNCQEVDKNQYKTASYAKIWLCMRTHDMIYNAQTNSRINYR